MDFSDRKETMEWKPKYIHNDIFTYSFKDLKYDSYLHIDKTRNVLYRVMKCGMICQSHAAQLPVGTEWT